MSAKNKKINTEAKKKNFELTMGVHCAGASIAVLLVKGRNEMCNSESFRHNPLDYLL